MTDPAGASACATVAALITRAAETDGRAPLSDQLAADLAHGAGTTIVAPAPDDASGAISGLAQVGRRPGGWTMQAVVDPAARTPDRAVLRRLVDDALAAIADGGGGRVDWWVFDARDEDAAAANAAGFAAGRELLQMRRPLPAPWSAAVATRPFRPGDEEAWLTVNNRAFARHPEQGGWTADDLHQRMAQPWFDPGGFLLHELDGRLAAFCWTKLHTDEQPVVGEIYVIGVDPDFQGRGLGRQLTLAGLDAIAARGVGHALLYVDGANRAAVALYHSLGFAVARADRAFVADVAAGVGP